MKPQMVVYTTPGAPMLWQFFRCDADDGDHAEEQLLDAEPLAHIVGVYDAANRDECLAIIHAEMED